MHSDIFAILSYYTRLSIILRWSKLAVYYGRSIIAIYFRNGAQSPRSNAILSYNERRWRNNRGNFRVYFGLFRVIAFCDNRIVIVNRDDYNKYVRNNKLTRFPNYYNIPGMRAYSTTTISSRKWYNNNISSTLRDNGNIILWIKYNLVKTKIILRDNSFSITILEYKWDYKITAISIISYNRDSPKWKHNRVEIDIDGEPYIGHYSHGQYHTEHTIYDSNIRNIGEIDKNYGRMIYYNGKQLFEYYFDILHKLRYPAIFYYEDGRIIREYR